MFIFHRSFWAVGAGIATACAIVAASVILNRPPSIPAASGPAKVSSEVLPALAPAS
ncbi:MAG TPA: hypothetical protein VGO53_08485 [Steroidobacteraceae bacterium]|nr:hypothetical protein [Steroidobacteraceae bacterium]